MKEKLINWWLKYRKHVVITAVIVLLALLLIFVGYRIDAFGFNGYHTVTTATSHSGKPPATITRTEVEVPAKSFWDWMQLLGVWLIPIMIAVFSVRYTSQQSQAEQANTQKRYENDQKIAEDKQRDELLQTYLDRMSDLLLEKGLRKSKQVAEVRMVARARTITVLDLLDARRKTSVIQFLYESELIRIIGLFGANLSETDLRSVDLSGINFLAASLCKANLRGTNLRGTDLRYTNLSKADLSNANLTEAYLEGANLDGANLSGAKITQEQLDSAKSIKNIIR